MSQEKKIAYNQTLREITDIIKTCEVAGWDGNPDTPAMPESVWKNAGRFSWSMFSFVNEDEHFEQPFLKPDMRVDTKGTLGLFWPSHTLSHPTSVGIVFRENECKISLLTGDGIIVRGEYQPVTDKLFRETLKTIYYGRNPIQESGRA
jgi:hypothetical protein